MTKPIFLIVWKDWKKYKILLFHRTIDAWQYVHEHNINSYSVYLTKKHIDHSKIDSTVTTEKVNEK